MKRVNEATAFTQTVRLFDSANAPVIPTTVRYRLDCKTTGTQILGWTDVTPASSLALTITGAQNAIQNRGNPVERKTVTVEADADLDTAFSDAWDYEVSRLNGF